MLEKTIKSFTQLIVWQKGHRLVLAVYATTNTFPKTEQYALTDQLRREAVSITSNIAEGFYRRSSKEKTQFYYIALGSLAETQNQLLIAKDLKYITSDKFNELISQTVEVAKLLNSIVSKLKIIKS